MLRLLFPLAAVGAALWTAEHGWGLFNVLSAPAFLGEKVSLSQIFAVLVGFAGVIVICKPGSDLLDPAAFFAVGSALF